MKNIYDLARSKNEDQFDSKGNRFMVKKFNREKCEQKDPVGIFVKDVHGKTIGHIPKPSGSKMDYDACFINDRPKKKVRKK